MGSVELTKDTILLLVRLQGQDRVLDSLQADIDRVPGAVKALQDALEARRGSLNDAKSRATRLQLDKKNKEIELGQKEEAIRKHSTELNQVKTNEAYRALQTEIDAAKAAAGELETGILVLMDEIDRTQREEKELAAALKQDEGRVAAEIAALEARRVDLEGRRDRQKSERDAVAAGIGPEILKHYAYLRRRKGGVAMAPVDGQHCGSCRMVLRPQVLVEITRGVELVSCDACQRILYYPEAPGDQPGPPAPAAAASGGGPSGPSPAGT